MGTQGRITALGEHLRKRTIEFCQHNPPGNLKTSSAAPCVLYELRISRKYPCKQSPQTIQHSKSERSHGKISRRRTLRFCGLLD